MELVTDTILAKLVKTGCGILVCGIVPLIMVLFFRITGQYILLTYAIIILLSGIFTGITTKDVLVLKIIYALMVIVLGTIFAFLAFALLFSYALQSIH